MKLVCFLLQICWLKHYVINKFEQLKLFVANFNHINLEQSVLKNDNLIKTTVCYGLCSLKCKENIKYCNLGIT